MTETPPPRNLDVPSERGPIGCAYHPAPDATASTEGAAQAGVIRGGGRLRLVVEQGGDDDAPGSWQQETWIDPLIGVTLEVVHRSGPPGGQPLSKVGVTSDTPGLRDAAGVEALLGD